MTWAEWVTVCVQFSCSCWPKQAHTPAKLLTHFQPCISLNTYLLAWGLEPIPAGSVRGRTHTSLQNIHSFHMFVTLDRIWQGLIPTVAYGSQQRNPWVSWSLFVMLHHDVISTEHTAHGQRRWHLCEESDFSSLIKVIIAVSQWKSDGVIV